MCVWLLLKIYEVGDIRRVVKDFIKRNFNVITH